MELKIVVVFLFTVLLAPDSSNCIRWLSLHHSHIQWNSTKVSEIPGRGIRSGIRSPCSVARRRYGLARLQAKLCRKSLDAMPHVQQAATLALDTCQHIFQHRRWNCSSAATAPYLTPDLLRATREQAYVYALSSAALTFTMARACASGLMYHCTCASHPQESPRSNFKWGGCGDNLKWGKNFAKKFLDNVEKEYDKHAKGNGILIGENEEKHKRLRSNIAHINLHNNKVGRRILTESLATQCKCHGVSGSCSIKTCWKSLPSMSQIGLRLLKLYTNAKEISSLALQPNTKSKADDQMIYLMKSPDYCTKDEKLGSFGTVGRKCNVTSNGTDSCRQLCCGRGYRTVVEEKIERCHCKYYYCCYVKCKICRTYTQTFECS